MSQQIKIALLMAASLFMEILDGTIVTTALPKNCADLSPIKFYRCLTGQRLSHHCCCLYSRQRLARPPVR